MGRLLIMTNQRCENCRHFDRDESMGYMAHYATCEYPVPAWLKAASNGGYVWSSSGEDCATWQPIQVEGGEDE